MASQKNIKDQVNPRNMTAEELKKHMQQLKEKDDQLVKGVFKFYEVPGGLMSFVYRKYKGQKIQRYSMVDGQVYTIPLGVAKHINTNPYYEIHEYCMDAEGKPSTRIKQKVKRCGFQSLEFMDIEEFDRGGQQIIQVENMAILG